MYLTDGVYLYEVVGSGVRNFGLLGGTYVRVRDVVSERVRVMCPVERALCREVG